MENWVLSITAFVGVIVSFASAFYIYKLNCDMKKMRRHNKRISEYLKSKQFLRMRNAGKDVCAEEYDFSMCRFNQSGDFFIGSKIK